MNVSRISIKTKGLLIVLTFSVIISAFTFYQSVKLSNANFEEIVNNKLTVATILTKEFIGKDFHDSIVNPRSLSEESYNKIANKLNNICNELDIQYLWSLLKINNNFVFTTASASDKILEKITQPKFFEIYRNSKFLNKIINKGIKSREVIQNKWGNFEAVLIPFVDSRGRSYIFGAAVNTEKYQTQATEYRNRQLISNTIFMLILTILAYFFFNFLVSPLTIIISNIQKIATGEFDFNKRNWAKEYNELAKNINFMYSEINDTYHTISIQEKDLRTTLMCIGDGVIVTDKNGIITRINNEAIKLTGWDKDDAKGMSLQDVFKIYDTKTNSNFSHPLEQVLISGKTIKLNRSIMLVSMKGTEYHISGVIAPILTDRIVTGTVLSFKNLTLEDQQAYKIRQNHEIMLDVLKLSKIAYWEYNVSDDTFWVSKEIIELYGIEEISEGNIDAHLLVSKYFDRNNTTYKTYDKIKESITSKKPFRSMHEVLNFKTNKPLFFDAAATPILNAKGDVEKLIGLTKDITEHKSLTHQLYHSQKLDAVGQLAGGVAHDFNNMLGGIIGFAELLLGNIQNDEKLQSYCNNIINISENAANLTSQLLSFARKDKSISTPVSIHKTIDSAITLLKRSINKGINIKTCYNASSDIVIGDPAQIESIIINLGINSRDAIENSGTITIVTDLAELSPSFCKLSDFDIEPGNYIVIKILDNGTGMNGETIEHIFEPFFTTKSAGKGTGLGLSVIHGIIAAHKGLINVYSELGKGTEFKIYLPINSDTIHSKSVDSTHSDDYHGTEGILLVDDEEVIRNMCKALLEDLGYNIFTAENGLKAIEIFTKYQNDISVVILDVVMPVMGGMECLKELKAINPDIKIIMASGFSRSETSSDFIHNGATDFIDKPYRQIVLAKAIKKSLEK